MKKKPSAAIRLLQTKYEETCTVMMNHLFVVYAFLLPLNMTRAQSFVISLMLLCFLMRGNYSVYLKKAINAVSIALLLFYAIHFIWSVGAEPITYNLVLKSSAFTGMYMFLFLSFLDKRFSLYALSAMLAAVMLSELLSYAMYLNYIPREFYFHQVNFPWKEGLQSIKIYQEDLHHEATPFLEHSTYNTLLVFSVAVMTYRVIKEDMSLWYKSITAFFMLTMTINISLIGGRIGYLLYIVLLATVVIYTFRRKALLPLAGLGLSLVIVFSAAYSNSPIFKKRIDTTWQTLETIFNDPTNFRSSFGSRLGLWYYSTDMIRQNPFFGSRQDNFLEEVYQTIPPKDQAYLRREIPFFHNAYVSTLVQFGLFGLIVFLNIFYQAARYPIKDAELNLIRLLSIVATMLFIAIGSFAYFIWGFFVAMLALSMASDFNLKQQQVTLLPKWKLIRNYSVVILLSVTMEFVQ